MHARFFYFYSFSSHFLIFIENRMNANKELSRIRERIDEVVAKKTVSNQWDASFRYECEVVRYGDDHRLKVICY